MLQKEGLKIVVFLFLSWLLYQNYSEGSFNYHLQRQKEGKNWSKKNSYR